MENEKVLDLIIIGAGPAGLSASIYASRYKLEHAIFGMLDGGQMSEIYEIDNYPGFPRIAGKDLIGKMIEHVSNFGVNITRESVSSIHKLENGTFEVKTPKNSYFSKSIILAMGAVYRKMNIPGEKEFTGKGVSYCATCDAVFFKDKTVSVIGGGNSAAVVALELVDYAKKIFLIIRGEKMLADPFWMDKISNESKIEIIKETQVIEIKGKEKVEKVILDKPYENNGHLSVDGVFIEVGTEPGVKLAKDLGVETDDKDFIVVKTDMSTNIPGVFAAGDITTGSNKFRQVLVATAEGSIAANSAYKMLKLK